MIAHSREADRGVAIVQRGLIVGVAAELHAAQIQGHLGRRQGVAQPDELTLGGFTAVGSIVVPAQQRQAHDLGHLRFSGMQVQAEGGKAQLRPVQGQAGGLQPALRQVRDALGPIGQGGDLGVEFGVCAALLIGQAAQVLGQLHRLLRLAAPGGVAGLLQCPGLLPRCGSDRARGRWRFERQRHRLRSPTARSIDRASTWPSQLPDNSRVVRVRQRTLSVAVRRGA